MAWLPAIHVIAVAIEGSGRFQGHPYFSRLLILAPSLTASFVGAYAGVLARYCWRQVRER